MSDLVGNVRVEVMSLTEIKRCSGWVKAFADERNDHRYYEIIENTLHPEFEYRYFAIRGGDDDVRSVQPFFILDQDILLGASPRIGTLTSFIRRIWPKFMKLRTLMVGRVTGEGHLDGGSKSIHNYDDTRLLASHILKHATDMDVSLIVLKEFPVKYRTALEPFRNSGFTRVPSLPLVKLGIDYVNFEDYLKRALNSSTRKKIRKKLSASTLSLIDMSVVTDIASVVDDVFPLYLQVYTRSKLHFEKLTKAYFCALGRLMPDKARFFVWRQAGKVIAFGSGMVQGDVFFAEYLGLDYNVAIELHLYHRVFRDLVTWAISNGYKSYHSSALNYDPKLHLKFMLDPVDLYVRHTSPILNIVMRWMLPWIEPTRYDKTLQKFSNFNDL